MSGDSKRNEALPQEDRTEMAKQTRSGRGEACDVHR